MGRSHLASSNWYLDAVIDSLETGYTKCYNTFSCLWWAQVSQLWILFWSLSETIRFLPLVLPHFFITPRLSNTCSSFAFILQVRNWKYSHSGNTSQNFFYSPGGTDSRLTRFPVQGQGLAWSDSFSVLSTKHDSSHALKQIIAPCLVETGGIFVRVPVCVLVCVCVCVWVCVCVCVCVVAQSCLTLCDLMNGSLPVSSMHRLFQAGILEGVDISSSRRSLQPRDWTRNSCIGS